MPRYYRKVIKIRAEDSPNVRWALAEIAKGREPSHREIVPGVLSYRGYLKRRKMWDKIKQCVSLDAEFYKGAEELLFPPVWLNYAEELAEKLKGKRRKAETIGVDPAEGGDDTSMCAIDWLGVIDLVSKKTIDTSVITSDVLAFAKKHGVEPKGIWFDAGGGGKQHADNLRSKGYKVNAVSFGSAASPEKKTGRTPLVHRKEQDETRYIYKNRRAEMYGMTSILLDPSEDKGFAIPREYTELRRQLAPIPRIYDEGKLVLPPKNPKGKSKDEVTMQSLIGRSPDDADALVLAVYGMIKGARRSSGAGVAF